MTQPSEALAQGFKCSSCGAQLTWDAGANAMSCQHCGTKQSVAQASGAGQIRSIPIEEGMRVAQRGLGAPVQTVGCKECGATVNVGEGERTTKCAFCGSQQVLAQATDANAIRPESLLPFGITKQVANDRFGSWLKTLWFRPGDLTKMASVQEMGGVYVPYWSFDSAVHSQWSAERGWYYQEEEQYQETNASGQQEWKTRSVQKTRWEPAAGSRQDSYRDILVCAGKGLPEELAAKFVSFEMGKLVPYRPEFLAGWRAESYTLDLMPGWDKGQSIITKSQEERCRKDIGGNTSQNLSVGNQFDQVAFKHVLLPVWIAVYRYNGKVYRFLVNGETGEVVGEAPWSVPKIVAMVLFVLALIGGGILLARSRHHADARPAPAAATPASPAQRAPAHRPNH